MKVFIYFMSSSTRSLFPSLLPSLSLSLPLRLSIHLSISISISLFFVSILSFSNFFLMYRSFCLLFLSLHLAHSVSFRHPLFLSLFLSRTPFLSVCLSLSLTLSLLSLSLSLNDSDFLLNLSEYQFFLKHVIPIFNSLINTLCLWL